MCSGGRGHCSVSEVVIPAHLEVEVVDEWSGDAFWAGCTLIDVPAFQIGFVDAAEDGALIVKHNEA